MSGIRPEELIRLVHEHYPSGLPPETDTFTHAPEPYLQTPEFKRWQDTWERALREQPWRAVLDGLRPQLPGYQLGSYTPASMAGGYACMASVREPRTDGGLGYRLIHVAAAISLIAPVYFVYGTVEVITPVGPEAQAPWKQHGARQQVGAPMLALPPTENMRPCAEVMARHVEHTLGLRPFPLELADVPVPDVRVPYLHRETPTLMNTLFFRELAPLP